MTSPSIPSESPRQNAMESFAPCQPAPRSLYAIRQDGEAGKVPGGIHAHLAAGVESPELHHINAPCREIDSQFDPYKDGTAPAETQPVRTQDDSSQDNCRTQAKGKYCSLVQLAIDRVAESLYLLDATGKLIYVNEAASRCLGYVRHELIGLRVFDINPDLLPEQWEQHWQATMTNQSSVFQSRHQTRHGAIFPVEIRSTRFEFDSNCYAMALARDISECQRTAEELRIRAQEFQALAENSPDIIVRLNRECRRLYANPALARLTGQAVETLLGKRPTDYAPTAHAHAYEEAVLGVIASGRECTFEYTLPDQSGRLVTCSFRLTPEFGYDGQVCSVLAIGRDISALKASEQRLQQAEAMARLGHWHLDLAGKTVIVSPEICRIVGQPIDWQPSINELLAILCDEEDEQVTSSITDALNRRETNAVQLFHRMWIKGQLLHLHTHVRIDYGLDHKPLFLIGTTQDITALKHYELQLHQLSFHDPLTGLPNRASFNQRLSQALEGSVRQDNVMGVLIIDLCRFEDINEAHGHQMGDRLLSAVAKLISKQVRDYDTVARLGGDEFAIILPAVREAANLGTIAHKILGALAQPFCFDNQEIFISACVGIAVHPADGTTANDLLHFAALALHDAKVRGPSNYHFYSVELAARSKQRAMLEMDLRKASARNEFELYYQPKISLLDGRLVGCEALLRWHHPTLGMVPPDQFISIAEDTGLIAGIGAWVLEQACQAARRWNENGQRIKVAINLSPRQFQLVDIVDLVSRCLADSGCQPEWIELEITESLLLGNNDGIREALTFLVGMGITIAIDDFGTGYSSLAYLKRFPIEVLKIDRSFIQDVMIDRDSTELVKAIITMAHSLGLELVAEGIETETQEAFLQNHGCQLGQGYRYGRPTPMGAFSFAEGYRLPGSIGTPDVSGAMQSHA